MNTPSKGKAWLIVGFTYALSVVLLTLPAALHLSQRLIGNNIDNWIFYWNHWWLEKAITEGHSWFETSYIFYPQGTHLVAHSISYLNSLLAIPLKPLVNPIGAYNLIWLLQLWLGAMGAYALTLDLTRRPGPAFLAGFVFTFAPYHITQMLGHGHLGAIHWWPFYILFLRRTLRQPRALDAGLAGLFAALTLWSGLQLAVLLAMWTLLYLGWHLFTEIIPQSSRWCSLKRLGISLGLTAGVALILSAPILIPVINTLPQLPDTIGYFDDSSKHQTDLLAYLIPTPLHPFSGARTTRIYERFVANRAHMPYLGYTALALSFVALLTRKQTRFWPLSIGVWVLLAAGSTLRWNGQTYEAIRLPYYALGRLFPISTIRAPDRFNLLVSLTLAVSAGIGATYLAKRWRQATLLPLILIAMEYLAVPLPTWALPPSSSFLNEMAESPSEYGVVNYPLGYHESKRWLYYQTLHGKPIVEGHVSRYTEETYRFILENPLLRTLHAVDRHPEKLDRELFAGPKWVPNLGPSLRTLSEENIRYILVHKAFLTESERRDFERAFPAVPIYEDEVLAVYQVTHPWPVHYDGLPVPLQENIELLRFDVQPLETHTEWRFQILARLLNAPPIEQTCEITLIGENGILLREPFTLFDTQAEGPTTWASGDAALLERQVTLPASLGPGAYRWQIHCAPGATYTAPDVLTIAQDGRTSYLRRRLEARYGTAVGLRGYRWRTVGANLHITLDWTARQTPAAGYKIFVHLLNEAGELVRQRDTIPCDWKCPTTSWKAGEHILDTIELPLWGLPEGEYRVAVGLYEPQSQERLPVWDTGVRQADDALILPEPFQIQSEAENVRCCQCEGMVGGAQCR